MASPRTPSDARHVLGKRLESIAISLDIMVGDDYITHHNLDLELREALEIVEHVREAVVGRSKTTA